jgi:hypothetical protein
MSQEDIVKYEFDLQGTSVILAIPCYRGVFPVDTVSGLMTTTRKFIDHNIRAGFLFERENALIESCRNRLVNKFLATDFQKLLFIDDDIIFEWEDIERLLCWGTKFPIVAASYRARKEPPTYYIQYDADNPVWNEYGLLKIRGCGLGFTLIDRSVFEKMEDSVPSYPDNDVTVKQFFRTGINAEGKYCGEDMLFFNEIVDKGGFDVWLDPAIKLGHFGNYVYRGDLLQANALSTS